MKRIIVIGGGAAGMMAAISAAEAGSAPIVLEKMPALGKKMLITGKGRCNITNSCDKAEFIKNMPGNGSFLHSALYAFYNQDIIDYLNTWGVPTKVERGGRVFPVSDKARDVVVAFEQAMKNAGIPVHVGEPVKEIVVKDKAVTGVMTKSGAFYQADAVILACGGSSYPATGASGDGYRMAKVVGHTITPLKPSLVPLEVAEDWIVELQGLSLKNVTATVSVNQKQVASEFGELLFTHYGLSGPVILSLSNIVSSYLLKKDSEILLEINLKPALSSEQLDKRIQRDFTKFTRKQYKNSLEELLPAKLIPVIIDLSHIDPDKSVNQITKEERVRLVELLQKLTFEITSTRPLSEAIVTAGGVSTKEINPATMESRIVSGLYFAGEVIDIDGYTGGFNLQSAFSTGFLAGRAASRE